MRCQAAAARGRAGDANSAYLSLAWSVYFNHSLIWISCLSTSVNSSDSLAREVFPNAALNRDGQKDLSAGRDMMKASNAFAEIDFLRHLAVFDWSIIHILSP